MRKFIFSALLAVICTQSSLSQNSEENKIFVKPGISLGLGIFYPKEINNYIEHDLSNYITTNANLYLNFFLRGSLGIQFSKMFVLEPLFEFAIAPKVVIGALYHYMWFKDFSAGTIGPAFQAGVSMNYGKSINPEVFAGFNYAKAQGKDKSIGNMSPGLELSYTDFHLGIRINFKM
jgi:hypothetical protein